ncbi:LEA type 2 family protein [Thermodesulfobacteriota bacterium]
MKRLRLIQSLSIPVVAGIALVMLQGCAGLGKRLESPEVSLAHIAVQEVKAFETAFELDLRIFNTNDIPLEIKAIDCELEVNGRKMAKGVSPTETTVPAFGTELIRMEVYSSMLEMVSSLLDMARRAQSKQTKAKLDYKLTGKLRLAGGSMMPRSIPFKYKGELDMQGITADKSSP